MSYLDTLSRSRHLNLFTVYCSAFRFSTEVFISRAFVVIWHFKGHAQREWGLNYGPAFSGWRRHINWDLHRIMRCRSGPLGGGRDSRCLGCRRFRFGSCSCFCGDCDCHRVWRWRRFGKVNHAPKGTLRSGGVSLKKKGRPGKKRKKETKRNPLI